jgi:hypothetical protein
VAKSERLKSVFRFFAEVIRDQSSTLANRKADKHVAQSDITRWDTRKVRKPYCHADEQAKPEVREELFHLASECSRRARAVFLACGQSRDNDVVATHGTCLKYIVVAAVDGKPAAVPFV